MVNIVEGKIRFIKEHEGQLIDIELTDEDLKEIGETDRLEQVADKVDEYLNNKTEYEQEKLRELIASEEKYDELIYLVKEYQDDLLEDTSSLLIEAAITKQFSSIKL